WVSHFPLLHRFLPFRFLHVPFLQVLHCPQSGLHAPEASGAVRNPSAPPRTAMTVRRRVAGAPSALAMASNRVSSTISPPDTRDELGQRGLYGDGHLSLLGRRCLFGTALGLTAQGPKVPRTGTKRSLDACGVAKCQVTFVALAVASFLPVSPP